MPTTSPGRYAGEDDGWVLSLMYPVLIDFDKAIMKYPNIQRFAGRGAVAKKSQPRIGDVDPFVTES